jgi:hypothetical protein
MSKSKKESGSWRYQAVYIEKDNHEGGTDKAFSICEVYLDEDDKLEMWTEKPNMSPYGESVEELTGDLETMLEDVKRWKSVNFELMEKGMIFDEN